MLKGSRVDLRPITYKDLEDLNRWKNNYDVFKNLGGGFNPVSIDQQKNWMDNMIDMNGNAKRFIIQTKDDQAIGMVGLYSINQVNRNCEFGIYIGKTNSYGKGYGTEATELMLDFAFNNLNLKKVKLLVNDDNPAIKMYERLKFEVVGKLKDERYVNGKYVDVIMMEKLIKECD